MSAGAVLGREKLVARRIENHPSHHFVLKSQPNRNAEHRKAVSEIRRAVERIHVPAVIGIRPLAAALLADDVMSRKAAPQPLDDQCFGTTVRLGDYVGFALVMDLVRAIPELREQPAGLAGDFDGDAKVRLHSRCGHQRSAVSSQPGLRLGSSHYRASRPVVEKWLSPSAQTTPSSKYSFFQMGTICFSRSMP